MRDWVKEVAALTKPDAIVWCDGSEDEKKRLTKQAVAAGILIELNQEKRPGCYLHRSNPNDVARTEQLTFVCTPNKIDAGPTNNWSDPADTYAKLRGMLDGSMRGRTMYVVPYVMGPLGSPLSKVGVELTDSLYVVLNMRIMTRMGKAALDQLGESDDFNRGIHCTLDLNPERRLICHFPQDNTIISVGSGYGGNALLSKKCFALRIASVLGRDEGWLAEHMLILGLQSPEGETTYIAAAFPSACGKTNLAMLTPPAELKGWKVIHRRRRHLLDAGRARRRAVGGQSRERILRRRARHQREIESERDEDGRARHDFHQRRDDARRRRVVGRDGRAAARRPARLAGPPVEKRLGRKSRASEQPLHDADAQQSGVVAVGRRSARRADLRDHLRRTPRHDDAAGARIDRLDPRRFHGRDDGIGNHRGRCWSGRRGAARSDGDAAVLRLQHGRLFRPLAQDARRTQEAAAFFMVNWFRKGADGNFIWPGYGENMRVLKWMLDRIHGRAKGRATPVGIVPDESELDLKGLDLSKSAAHDALAINPTEWKAEIESEAEFFEKIGPTMPKDLKERRQAILKSLNGEAPARQAASAR